MKKITLWLMKYQLKKAKESLKKETNTIVAKAKKHRIKAFKSAIIFLK